MGMCNAPTILSKMLSFYHIKKKGCEGKLIANLSRISPDTR